MPKPNSSDEARNDDAREEEDALDITREQWIEAQRELATASLDYNLNTVAELVGSGSIALDPHFQRRDRWDQRRKSKFIESFLMNIPLQPVFLNEDEYGAYSVIDGKQRLSTVVEFMTDQLRLTGLSVFVEANGKRFSQLDASLRAVLSTRAAVRAIIVLRLSNQLMKYHLFERLNTGAVLLNPQEIRNQAFAGRLNEGLIGASSYPPYRATLGINPDRQKTNKMWQEMKDVELVLRFLTFDEHLDEYAGSANGSMNQYMAQHQHDSDQEVNAHVARFQSTLDKCLAAFGDTAFKRWDQHRGKYRLQVLTALYDAQMLACREFAIEDLRAKASRIQEQFRELSLAQEFQRAISGATNTPSFLRTRIEMVREVLVAAVEG